MVYMKGVPTSYIPLYVRSIDKEIFNEIEAILDKNIIMVKLPDGKRELVFDRKLEVDIEELRKKFCG